MKRTATILFVSTLVLTAAPLLRADVKTQHKTTFQMGGMLGGLVNRFAGDAAKDGVVSTMAVKGPRQMSTTAQTGRIVDLTEEKVYDLDLRKKEYKVTTFAELRKQWQDAQAKAQKDAKNAGGDQPADPSQSGKQVEVSFTVKETGQTKSIAGHNTKETVLTITMREKGKTLEESGGMELISHMWLAPKIAALDEIGEFNRKYMTAVYGNMMLGMDQAQMTMLIAQYPSFKELSDKLAVEGKKLAGTALLTVTQMDVIAGPQDAKASQSQSGGGGGLMGRLANRMASRGGGGKAGDRSTIFTSNDETMSIETTVTAEDTAIPAGFKEKK